MNGLGHVLFTLNWCDLTPFTLSLFLRSVEPKENESESDRHSLGTYRLILNDTYSDLVVRRQCHDHHLTLSDRHVSRSREEAP